jgi:signal transduction histidine kinase
MRRAALESLSVRIALAVGFVGTLGLWLYTNYAFTKRIESVQHEATQLADRYANAQEQLATVRSQVLVSSVRVRDALLDPTPAVLQESRDQLVASSQVITTTLADYQPVLTADSGEAIARLTKELEQFHRQSMEVLANAGGSAPLQVREVLNRQIGPHRDRALAISEEIQAINRRAYIREQTDVVEIQRLAEAQSRDRIGIAFAIGLGMLLLTSAYAARLEVRLRAQLVRDARISSELQQTAAKVLNAQEESRRTIARELHDEVGQALTAIRVELDIAERAITTAGGSAAALTEAQAITDGALQTVRNLAQLLHPAALDDLGLPAVIDASLRGLKRRYNIRGTLEQTNLPAQLSRDVELAAYRIVQEGLTNVAKHASATRCDVRLTQLPDRLLVEVEDDGIGFIEDTDRPIIARGLGLVSIRERVSRLGGTFSILSSPGAGTRLIVSLPEKSSA